MYKLAGLILIEDTVGDWEPLIAEQTYHEIQNDFSGHDIYHCLRVKRLAMIIGKAENLEIETLVATAYLHDIGRVSKSNQEENHVKIGVAKAKKIMSNADFPSSKIPGVLDCIEHHEDYPWNSLHATSTTSLSLECLGFQDADRLDALGAIGIARVFTFGGANQIPDWVPDKPIGEWDNNKFSPSSFHHINEKLLKLKDLMNTNTGKKIAESRVNYTLEFVEKYKDEWFGTS